MDGFRQQRARLPREQQAEGEHDRIGTALARATEQLSWCSNDPVCSESNPQNLDGLNLAACHSCLLAAETSVEDIVAAIGVAVMLCLTLERRAMSKPHGAAP